MTCFKPISSQSFAPRLILDQVTAEITFQWRHQISVSVTVDDLMGDVVIDQAVPRLHFLCRVLLNPFLERFQIDLEVDFRQIAVGVFAIFGLCFSAVWVLRGGIFREFHGRGQRILQLFSASPGRTAVENSLVHVHASRENSFVVAVGNRRSGAELIGRTFSILAVRSQHPRCSSKQVVVS